MVTAAAQDLSSAEERPGQGRRVLLVTAHFPPNRRAGTHRLLRFARNLDALGWRVSVLTLEPDAYRDGVPLDEQLLKEVPPSVQVTRTSVPGRRGSSPSAVATRPDGSVPAAPRAAPPPRRRGLSASVRRFWQELTSTPDQELPWWLSAVPAGTAIARERQIDVLVSSAPPFTTHLIAAEIARRTGLPWVADFRDPWSRAPWGVEWRNKGWTGWVHRRLEGLTIRRATRVILNTRPMLDDFVAHYPRLVKKFVAIPNGFDSDALERGVRSATRTAPPHTLVLCHTGSLYQARDPRPLLRALAVVLQDGQVPGDAYRLQLVGGAGGSFDTAGEVARLGLTHAVEFVPPVSHGESLGYLRAADVLLVVQPDTAVQVPVKLYEYLWARKPILALASPGAVADLVREGKVGTVVAADDERAIAEALRAFYRQRATLATDYVAPAAFLEELEGTALTKRLHDLLMGVTT
jgi:glycosyltransferase involved in cell wall biosynthesis